MQKHDEVKKETLPTVADTQRLDGFDDFNDEDGGSRVIQGALVKFTNECTWESGDEELPPDLELIVIDVSRVVQKWHDGNPVETIVLVAKEPWPDIKAMNAATPREEWEDGPDGHPRGPWQGQYITYLWNEKTGGRYTYATGTIGGGLCVRELIKDTNLTRDYRGDRVYPVVTLGDVFMNTRYGGRQRPRLKIMRWVTFGKNKTLPAPDTAKLQGPQEVKPVTAKEITDDEIPF